MPQRADDWVRLAHLLSGRHIGRGAPEPLGEGDFGEAWRRLRRASGSGEFRLAERPGLPWHERRAANARADRDDFGLLWHLERLRSGPQSGQRLAECGLLHLRLGELAEACDCYDRAAVLGVIAWEPWALRADRSAGRGQWDRAAADLDRALRSRAAPPVVLLERALVHMQQGDREGYRKDLALLLRPFGDVRTSSPWLRRLLHVAVTVPDCGVDPARLVALAAAQPEDQKGRGEAVRVEAMALYRAGRYPEAMRKLREVTRSEVSAFDGLFLAMLHHRLDQAGDARQWLDRTQQWLDRAAPPRGFPWQAHVQLRLLRREAETLLAATPPEGRKRSGGEDSP